MVFMIKLPPALAMSPPIDHRGKDDRLSLLKNLHRPNGQIDGGVHPYGQETFVQQPYNRQQQSRSFSHFETEKIFCLRQQFLTAAAIIVVTSLVAFVLFVTTFRKVPTDDSFLNIESMSIPQDFSTTRGQIAVKTSCGHVIGKSEEGAYAFKGIAYASPPVGPLRWRKPVPLWVDSTWCEEHNTQEAFHFGTECFQLNPYTKNFEGSEDCLFLNVWTPSLDTSKGGLDVMVWIHGGFLQFGNGNQAGLSPSAKLAKKMNMVFVSMNYRLYTLGFMALELLSDNILTDSKGNYGLWDQLCALQWIKDNIRNFGGDPRKVTLFGPDAGAASIMALISSPKAQGLFRSAWLVGPTMVFNRTFEEVTQHNKGLFLQRSNCEDARCLRKSAAQDIITAHLGKDDASFRIRDQNDLPIQGIFPEQLIVMDGDLLVETPETALSNEDIKSIPLLLGSSAQAVDFWPGPDDLSTWTWNQYKKYVTTSLDSFGLQVSQMALQIYNGTSSQANNLNFTAEYLYTTMVSDIRQSCPVNTLAKKLASVSRSPVYRYTLTERPPSPVKLFNYTAKYSFHLWDLISFFESTDYFLSKSESEENQEFSEVVQNMVASFVRSGGENVGEPNWLRYPKKTANLAKNITVGEISKKECKFWSESKLDVYAWVS
ncbi:para-nitrobenzyl esterase-like isoform X2 [Parasteatoda tepidariorum]|uniref:para-nitrobenzyl esterase-like isoform X2 n=1 Tax=Parasteatoda tepidariorum TaxID=114398 RepID=UPI001C728A8B|nr:para-nitrobenzyl esterase-like isoform X2 [Parasteatoda tepidariorum]